MRCTLPYVCAIVLFGAGVPTSAGLITMSQTHTRSEARNDYDAIGYDSVTYAIYAPDPTIPASPPPVVAATSDPGPQSTGRSTASTSLKYTESPGQTLLEWDLDHARAAKIFAGAASYQRIEFTANADTTYNFSGTYELTGSRSMRLSAYLYDYTAGQFLLESNQLSNMAAGDTFTLGGMAGDDFNLRTGSLTGSLIAGHSYVMEFTAYISSYGGSNTSFDQENASAVGEISLTIGDPMAVPEPASMTLVGFGGFGAICCRWRRTRAAKVAV